MAGSGPYVVGTCEPLLCPPLIPSRCWRWRKGPVVGWPSLRRRHSRIPCGVAAVMSALAVPVDVDGPGPGVAVGLVIWVGLTVAIGAGFLVVDWLSASPSSGWWAWYIPSAVVWPPWSDPGSYPLCFFSGRLSAPSECERTCSSEPHGCSRLGETGLTATSSISLVLSRKLAAAVASRFLWSWLIWALWRFVSSVRFLSLSMA